MKSFYQFYESIPATSPISANPSSAVFLASNYTSVYVVFEQVSSISIRNVYADYKQALAAIYLRGQVATNTYIKNPLPPDGEKVYVVVFGYNDNIAGQVFVDKNRANKEARIFNKIGYKSNVLTATFVANTSAKPLSTPKSPLLLKYPLIGELNHYLSTQSLNQEIYHVMRDKSQKSINLLNNLRTLINKIELA